MLLDLQRYHRILLGFAIGAFIFTVIVVRLHFVQVVRLAFIAAFLTPHELSLEITCFASIVLESHRLGYQN